MDINDTAGIQALLEQLRSSQAWQDAVGSPEHPDHDAQKRSQSDVNTSQSSSAAPSTSVAALLSQLQAESHPESHANVPDHTFESAPTLPSTHPATEDTRYLTFQEALPVIASLSANAKFSQTLKMMKSEQDVLENRLSNERKAIIMKYEEKVKIARTKASLIGSGISKHEAAMLSDAFQKELKSFDSERVLSAWDGLVLQQQETLARMGVPTMFSTTVSSERERQQKIMQVLHGLI